jgi:glycosyltransferase involved in cell wall biosynthesis
VSPATETREAAAAGAASTRPSLTVVVPVLDEERSLEELHERLRRALPGDAEVLIVDDGSSDGTPAILADLSCRDPLLRVVRFRRTFGKSMALLAGFRRAGGEIVATLDGDLQEDPADIPRLAERLASGYDLVSGWRKTRHDRWTKVLGSRLFNRLVSLLSGVRFHDINCGLKVLRREVVEELVLGGGFHRFIPLLAHWKGFRVTEAEVAHAPRKHGKSRYRGDRIVRGLLDLAVILFLVRHEGRPGRYFAALGTLLGAAGASISAYLAYLRLRYGTIFSHFPLLSLGLVLLIVGVQLFSMGLFGELLAYHFRSRRPFEPALWDSAEDGPPERGRPR